MNSRTCLLISSAAAKRDAQQCDQLGQARPQQIGDAGRAEHRGPVCAVEAVGRLAEVHDVHRPGEIQQSLLGIQELELATVAGGKLEHGYAGLRAHSSCTSSRSPISS